MHCCAAVYVVCSCSMVLGVYSSCSSLQIGRGSNSHRVCRRIKEWKVPAAVSYSKLGILTIGALQNILVRIAFTSQGPDYETQAKALQLLRTWWDALATLRARIPVTVLYSTCAWTNQYRIGLHSSTGEDLVRAESSWSVSPTSCIYLAPSRNPNTAPSHI